MNFTNSPYEKMMKEKPSLPPGSGAQTAQRLPLPGLQLLEQICLRGRLLPGFDFAAKRGNFGPTSPEGRRMSAEPRELTRRERAAIRRLVTGMCANYDPEYSCLPLDYGSCYMLDKCWTGHTASILKRPSFRLSRYWKLI